MIAIIVCPAAPACVDKAGGHTVNLSVLFNENRVAKNDWAECFTQPSKWLNLLVLNVWHEWPPHGGDKTLSTRPWTEFIPRFRGGARPVCGHENAHRGGAENSPGGALPGAKGLEDIIPPVAPLWGVNPKGATTMNLDFAALDFARGLMPSPRHWGLVLATRASTGCATPGKRTRTFSDTWRTLAWTPSSETRPPRCGIPL